MPEDLDAERFEEVKESGETWMVDFWAEWCGPCKQTEPIVEEISEEMDDIKVGKVDVDEYQELATAQGVRSIPTFVILEDGEEVSRQMGAMGKEKFESWIEENK
ncbi:MAG: thioredoxin [Candidatus Nanohaloarchaeota archaeon QJJ-7]|nr:thioredoxin [Candidatus Nanohaloarchaeota archaeon QJJ-7]